MANRLARSTSPYLQQHAGNPVDWHEWGPEALALARETGKPILLSVGYSACHWCHVMAHESFEDDDIAALMNRLYVNIKVDREERPDIDQIYQMAHAMLAQRSGGWPLTMFLTPETTPFYGGTYFPKTPRHGLPGFGDLLARIAEIYRQRPDDIRAQSEGLRQALRQEGSAGETAGRAIPGREAIEDARHAIVRSFDAHRGGFGRAPKFPHPEMLEFCLRRYAESADADVSKAARHAACFTLERMCRGGIYDQLGGGFARYSTDADWAIPHFEKMLYDNGPLLRLLADAWLVAENPEQRSLFSQCAEDTAAFVMREMQSPSGGYYSTLDADSEGHEGKFYVWTPEQVEPLLAADEWAVVRRHYGLDRAPNFEGEAWHPVEATPLAQVASALSLDLGRASALLASAKRKLFAARETRIRPGRDEKVLTSWNALMIEGMAHAARVFGRDDWLASARRALDFVNATMWDPAAKRLRATHRDGRTHLNAYLDDYACLARAILAMLQAEFRGADLDFAREIADVLLAQFEDREHGGFYFTSHDHEQLIQRPKPGFDNATPSGNGVAAVALQRLAHLVDAPDYARAARQSLEGFGEAIARHPSGHCSLLFALEEWLDPPRVTILAGPQDALRDWQREAASRFAPSTMTLAIPNEASGVPDLLRRPPTAAVHAYVCRGTSCLPAITSRAELARVLG